MELLVYGKFVTFQGQAVEMHISSLQSHHLGNYYVTIRNGKVMKSTVDVSIMKAGDVYEPVFLFYL